MQYPLGIRPRRPAKRRRGMAWRGPANITSKFATSPLLGVGYYVFLTKTRLKFANGFLTFETVNGPQKALSATAAAASLPAKGLL